MNYRHFLVITLFFISNIVSVCAKEITATLQTSSRDKITIKYNVISRDEDITIVFNSVNVVLGLDNSEKYKKYSYVKPLFFDRSGNYLEDSFLSDIETEAVKIPFDDIEYTQSKEGYVWLKERPEIRLKLLSPKFTLSLPIYLAYYVKPHKYKIFASCGNLDIQLSKSAPKKEIVSSTKGTVTKTVTITEEIEEESDLTPDMEAEIIIGQIEDLLQQEYDNISLGRLEKCYDSLWKIEPRVKDKTLKSRISKALQEVEKIKRDYEKKEKDGATDAIYMQKESEARKNLEYLKERLDNIEKLNEGDIAELKATANELRRSSYEMKDQELANQMKQAADQCDDEVKKIEETKKSRNMWLIIGGILLVILMFIGNILFQHYRSVRSRKNIEKDMMEMQRRAENDAKRRARGLVSREINRAQSTARQKSQNVVRNGVKNGVNNIANGKKSISI